MTLDKNALIRIADGFAREFKLAIGIYYENTEAILSNEAFRRGDVLNAVNKLGNYGVERVIDLSASDNKMSGIAMRNKEGKLYGVWLIKALGNNSTPLDTKISLIENVLFLYIREREAAYNLENHIKEKEREGSSLNRELARNEAITQILSKIESEDDFDVVVKSILTISGEFLEASNAFIIQLDKNNDKVHILAEWFDKDSGSFMFKMDDTALSEIPFTDGLSYTISSDSRVPKSFSAFLEAYDISAGIFLPIFLDNENIMYLCTSMNIIPRHWTLLEAGFLNTVRRVISSILSRRIAKNSLASSYAVVESVLENIGCGVIVMEKDSTETLYTNDTFRKMLSNQSDRQRFERRIQKTPEKMEQIREYYLEEAGIYVSIALGMIKWVDDSYVRLATVFDITENKEYENHIERHANIDELTGIYNRTYFVKELGSLALDKDIHGAYLCMNLDDFKEINIISGNTGGDMLLSSIAKFLLKLSEENARVYRLGADEFAIIIKDTSKLDPLEVSRSIIRRFKAPWQLNYKDCFLTASIGIARFPEDAKDVGNILKCGDIALGYAKSNGTGSVEFYQEYMEEECREHILLKSYLIESVADECNGMELSKTKADFNVYNTDYEGEIVNLAWQAPELGTKLFCEFMPMAKRYKLYNELLERFILLALRECRYNNDIGYPQYHIGIPISLEDMGNERLLKFIEESIDECGVNPDNLVIIIYGMLVKDKSRAEENIERIRKLGIHTAPGNTWEGISCDHEFDAKIIC